jgi:5-methylcytosine-specific restriction endonuclease McrA
VSFADIQRKNDYQNEWMKKRRLLGIMLLGGRCVVCGATTDLEIDHVNPDTKVSHRIWSWSWNRIIHELVKCQLLCHDDHRLKTKVDFPDAIGSIDRYEVFG